MLLLNPNNLSDLEQLTGVMCRFQIASSQFKVMGISKQADFPGGMSSFPFACVSLLTHLHPIKRELLLVFYLYPEAAVVKNCNVGFSKQSIQKSREETLALPNCVNFLTMFSKHLL